MPWKVRVGTLAKRMLDMARLRGFLAAIERVPCHSGPLKYYASLRLYVSSDVTPENVALVAWRANL